MQAVILIAALLSIALAQQPVFKVNVIARSTKAVNYQHRSGATEIEFRGTAILPKGEGKARIESKQGRIEVSASFSRLAPAYTIGPEYLTFVLWAITPEGRAQNLGELLLSGQKSKIEVTTELQVFGLIVTAEPYFAVTQPSDVIVMENEIRPDTRGRWDVIDAKYELLQRGQFAGTGSAQPPTWSPKIPLELIEARNAVRIARLSLADKYAADIFEKAAQALASAEDYHDRQAGWRPVSMLARESVQRAEDARVVALRRQQEERLDNERKLSAQREAEAKATAETETRRREKAEADRAAMEKAKLEAEALARRAEQDRIAAETARLESERLRKEAEQARLASIEQQRRQTLEADLSRRLDLRKRLHDQLQAIFETAAADHGLLVRLPESIFDSSPALLPEGREKLARIAGLIAAHPGLEISTGAGEGEHGPARNAALRGYFLTQGVIVTEAATPPPAALELLISGDPIAVPPPPQSQENPARDGKLR
ncbi:MAG: OmpA family protein [Bryobacteraceae bacterium]|nr:OmpA family protein [Bryobacteraceae bacterium]